MKLSFSQIEQMVRKALGDGQGYGHWIVELYEDRCIYEEDSSRNLYQVDYAIVDGKVTLGTPVKVEKKVNYVEVSAQAAIRVTAAVGGKESEDFGYKWRVRIVEFGVDKNDVDWAKQPIMAALKHYEGAKVFALTEAQHQAKPHPFGKSSQDLVGWMENVSDTGTALEADFNILKGGKGRELRDMIVDAFERGNPELIGFSHDVAGTATVVKIGNRKIRRLKEIKAVTVDVVYDPAAGGKFLNMVAAKKSGRKEEHMLEKLLAALKAKRPDLYGQIEAKVDDGSITEGEVLEIYVGAAMKVEDLDERIQAAVKEQLSALGSQPSGNNGGDGGGDGGAGGSAGGDDDPVREARIIACRIALKEELKESGLPEIVRKKIHKRFDGEVFEDENLQAAIKEEKEVLDHLSASGNVSGFGDLKPTGEQDNVNELLDDFFNGKFNSFKAAYIRITGDEMVTGQMRAATRLAASIQSGTFAEVLGDAVARKMLAEYNASGLQDWRKIVDVVPVGDFRTQHRTRIGGYGDLPAVAESGAYAALASPTDEEATYAVSKKGGTEDVTLETIKNDDVGVIRKIPRKLSRAAARTLYKFVFDFLATNPTIYDTTALFTAGHNNLGAAALDAATLAANRLAMIKQTEADSGEQLGIGPKFLVVPPDLQKTAEDLVIPPSAGQYMPNSPDFLKRMVWEVITVLYWTDANNWYASADPADIPTIEIAFLDGKEEPELFVQDMPNVGSMFSNDQLTYKIRHIYGGNVMDFRGLQGNVVV